MKSVANFDEEYREKFLKNIDSDGVRKLASKVMEDLSKGEKGTKLGESEKIVDLNAVNKEKYGIIVGKDFVTFERLEEAFRDATEIIGLLEKSRF